MTHIFETNLLYIFLYGALLAISVLVMRLAITKIFRASHFLVTGINARATVVKIHELLGTQEDFFISNIAVFEFVEPDGKITRFEQDINLIYSVWKIGEEVSIVYDPKDPASIKIVSYWTLFRTPIIMIMLGAPLFFISIGYFIFLLYLSFM